MVYDGRDEDEYERLLDEGYTEEELEDMGFGEVAAGLERDRQRKAARDAIAHEEAVVEEIAMQRFGRAPTPGELEEILADIRYGRI